MRSALPLVIATAVTASIVPAAGCLEATHRIPHDELLRLASTPPEQRGQHVRVIQELVAEQPPPAEPVTENTSIDVLVVGHVDVGGGHGAGRPPRRPPSRGGGGGGKGALHHVGAGDAKADDAWLLFVAAAAAGVALAFTEGARYDGWVDLHPMYPVHLYGPDGYTVMPLAAIDPATAAWATRAVVVPGEGPWRNVGRAPLDRAGFTMSVLLGAASSVSSEGGSGVGTSGRLQVGFFPTHAVGLQLDWGFSVRDNAVGGTLFDSRLGGELTFAPLDVGRFHGGVFGGLAVAQRTEDGVRDGYDDGTAVSGGALLQLELTTRLALTGRLGVSRAFGDTTRDAMLGFSVY